MENQTQEPNNNDHHHTQIKKNNNSPQNYSRKLSNSHISMSDNESITSQVDSFHSPLPSPINSKAIVTVDKYFTPHRSPHNPSSEHLSFPPTPVVTPPPSVKKGGEVVYNYSRGGGGREGVKKVERGEGGGGVVERGEGGGGGGGGRKGRVSVGSISRRTGKEGVVKKSALGFRVCEVVFCLVSFSVMAADKTQGWAGDSFDRYKEYRYCLAMNVIGFVYAGFQAFDLSCNLASGKHIISHHLRYHFEFLMDQILAYLLMSASSSAATRVDDWVTNWGKDPFTDMATASVGMSFLAFFAFAISSLISGYNLCNQDTS